MIKVFLNVLLVGLLGTQYVYANGSDQAGEEHTHDVVPTTRVTSTIPTVFDPSTWGDHAGHITPGQTIAINPADPSFWEQIVNPETHSKMHMAFTNPAQYQQMMTPGFYVQMMNPAVWIKWMQPQSYQTMMNPQTWTYWMQPGAYVHGANPAAYAQMVNPAAYFSMMNNMMYMGNSNVAANNDTNIFSWFGVSSLPYGSVAEKP